KERHRLALDAERRHAEDLFAFDAQRLPARGQHAHIGASSEQGIDELGARVEEGFAIVEHHEHPPLGEVAHQAFDAGAQEVEAEAGGDGLPQQLGVRERRQVNKEDTLGEVLHEASGSLEGEARLAASTDSGQGHQLASENTLAHLGELVVAADERGPLDRKVVAQRFEGTKRGELASKAGRADLESPLGLAKVAQTMLTKVSQPDVGPQSSPATETALADTST